MFGAFTSPEESLPASEDWRTQEGEEEGFEGEDDPTSSAEGGDTVNESRGSSSVDDSVMNAILVPSMTDTSRQDQGMMMAAQEEAFPGNQSQEGFEVFKRGNSFETRSHVTPNGTVYKSANWVCQPYKREVLQQQLDNNSPGAGRRMALVGTLKDMGVKTFIVDGKSIRTTADVLHHVKRVVGYVARENRVYDEMSGPLGFQRCLLYQDPTGRLFNLMLSPHAVGPAAKYEEYLDTFSGMQAMLALMVLCRSFPCAFEENMIATLKPAYLSLIIGLVLTEEISLSFLNVSMLIRALPSVSAHTLSNKLGSDTIRKAVVFSLALASGATGIAQRVLTLVGIGGACVVLLANIGARAWHFMKWKPIRYQGPGAAAVAYLAAVGTGVVVPYMGHRNIEIGGKAAMEYVIRTAFLVAIGFVASDFDEIQKFLIIGSESCPQDMVNIVMGAWWTLSLFISMFLVRKIEYTDNHPEHEGEPLLIQDHASPVGYKVPSVPDFIIDPAMTETGARCLSTKLEFVGGLFMAALVGGAMIYLGFTDWDDDVFSDVQGYVGDIF